MMWLDSETYGLVSMDGETILAVDLADGSVETTSFEEEGIRLLRGTEPFLPTEFNCMEPLDLARGAVSGEGRLVFVSPRADYSADFSLFADGEQSVQVWQVGTGKLVWSSDAAAYDDDRVDQFGPAWSPVEPTHLAVSECKVDIECQLERLFVVDVATGEVAASYLGQFLNVSWSHDGSTILYQIPFALVPCVRDLATGDSECFWEVIETHFPSDKDITDRDISDLRWDRHGEGFFYAYEGIQHPSSDQGTPMPDHTLSGLCHFELSTHEIDCPSEDEIAFTGRELAGGEQSPDERFAYVQTIIRDRLEIHGVLDLENHNYIELPNPPGDREDAVSILWRPPSAVPISDLVRTIHPTRQEAQDVPSIWAFYDLTEELDLAEPGTRSFSVDVDAASTFIWPFYWCASDVETLADNLRSINVDFTIDGVELPATDILEYKMLSAEWDCQFWATTLSGWQTGSEPSLAIRYSFSQDVFDGVGPYPAGEYLLELNVRAGR
jgi:hypothetical protein